MITNPWEPDRALSLQLANDVVRASFPSIESRGLRLLGSGWEFDAYLTRDGWVVRFPRRKEAADLFDRERAVHALVSRFLPATVAVPAAEVISKPTGGFPYPVAAHRYIAGIPVDELPPRFQTMLPSQLGATLGALHGIPERDARGAGLQESQGLDEDPSPWFEHGLDVLSNQADLDPIVMRAADWVGRAHRKRIDFDAPLRVIHQDLSPEHVLADPDSGRLTGLLDWTDAMLGDAARDFVFIAGWQGWSYVDEVLRHYPPVDEGFRERIRFMARLLTPMWLAYAYERGTEVDKMRMWVHNAYGD